MEQYRLPNEDILNASTWTATYLAQCGLYEKAAALDQGILQRKQNVLGREHLSTLTSMNTLAGVWRNQGKHEEAEEMHRQALALRYADERVLPCVFVAQY